MMFYTQLFTSKKGPLAKIWLAAHWERKLTKANVFECNLENTVKDIISPKMKIGLRTSGHLLLGVVRIYSRKAKYLLADCSDALVKIRMSFRPDQTDLPVEEQEAAVKAITLMEDFTDFDVQLPDPSNIDMGDHFSLNQCRTEEITLKEEFGNFFNFSEFDTQSNQPANVLLDMTFQSFTQHTDMFGDEGKEYDILDFLTHNESEPEALISECLQDQSDNSFATNDRQDTENPVNTEPSTVNVTLLANEEEAFALDPVPVTPTLEKKKRARKRKLVVDQAKQLTNDAIQEQLADYSDLIAPLDMAPPTRELMTWKESGGADKLLVQLCSSVVTPEITELFVKNIFERKHYQMQERGTELVDGEDVRKEINSLKEESFTVGESTVEPEVTHNTELTAMNLIHNDQQETYAEQEIEVSDLVHPELPSEDSLFVQQSHIEQDSLSTLLHTQSMLNSQDFGERKIIRRAQKLLSVLQNQRSSDPFFSFKALCNGNSRFHAATTFFCFLVLKKQQALQLQQSAPYEDIIGTPGPRFNEGTENSSFISS